MNPLYRAVDAIGPESFRAIDRPLHIASGHDMITEKWPDNTICLLKAEAIDSKIATSREWHVSRKGEPLYVYRETYPDGMMIANPIAVTPEKFIEEVGGLEAFWAALEGVVDKNEHNTARKLNGLRACKARLQAGRKDTHFA